MTKEIVLRNARLIDGVSDRPRDKMSIVIKDGRIASVTDGDGPAGAGAEIIDCSGKTVMSGLIDTHVHSTFIDRTDLTLFLAAGVTAAVGIRSEKRRPGTGVAALSEGRRETGARSEKTGGERRWSWPLRIKSGSSFAGGRRS